MNMTYNSRAALSMINYMAKDTYERVTDFFKVNDCDFAYWGKDEFLRCDASDDEKKSFVERHKEINDLNDHTIVRVRYGAVILSDFCPKLKKSMKELYDSGFRRKVIDGVDVYLHTKYDNYELIIEKP